MKPSMILQALTAIVLAYAAVVALVYVIQPNLVYFPDVGREIAATPKAVGLDFESVQIRTEDGERLDAWWVPVAEPRGAVLLFHGNAGNISHRLDYLQMFHRLRYSALIFDYRGYGRSTGTPSEEGTYRDAAAAWRWLTQARGIPPADIVLYGESLGAAVASWLGAREMARALVLASTFTSAVDLGAEVYFFLPVRLISRFKYDNRANLQSVRAPVLVVHSGGDDIVPFAHGRALYQAAREPKEFLELTGGHNDGFVFMRPEWIAKLDEFLTRAEQRKDAPRDAGAGESAR